MDTLDDNQKEIIDKYKRELLALIENMESDMIPAPIITQILEQGSKGYLKIKPKTLPSMKVQYIDKTFPITLQDLIDLAKSKNRNPNEIKLILNDSNPDNTGYTKCAVLTNEGINLYAPNGVSYDLREENHHKPGKKTPKGRCYTQGNQE